MNLGIQGKRALVLAASQGLGKSVAKVLIDEGVQVIISSSDETKLAKAATDLGASGYIPCDLTNLDDTDLMLRSALQQYGPIDILVTNTGGPAPGMFKDLSNEDWHTAFQSMFMSVVQCVRAVIPGMTDNQWGRIVMLTSSAGKEPIENLTLSNAIRAGVHGLMKTLSHELGPDGITLNAVLTGFTETERLKQWPGLNDVIKSIPAGRIGQPDEFARLVSFLVSENAGYISGQGIAFDGGSMHSL